jgi:peptide/nickel transport system substrate-binding protein
MKFLSTGTAATAVAALTGFAVACGGTGSSSDGAPSPAPGGEPAAATTIAPEGQPQAGGVYRVGVESSFAFSNSFDPTGEYTAAAFAIYGNLLLRTLLGYHHVAGPEGNELIPDLAERMPEVSADGLTYTLRLREGVLFGPPVSREITSRDVAYAFERIGSESLVAQYGFYYDVIEGMAEFREGKAQRIAGILTPDDRTIVFRLTSPTGDFPFRLSMPATAAIPEEVGRCFAEAGEYGRYLIASGPYMIEGSDELDISSCEATEPLAGFDPNTSLELVRNPNYDPATDTREARENFPDRFEFVINTNNNDIFDKIKAGELEGELASAQPKIIREYTNDEGLEGRLHATPTDSIYYITLNLTQPPFDDIHVRKAANLVIDKQGLRVAFGGPLSGEIATHVVPNAMLDGLLDDYNPYPSPDGGGDEAGAREEMKLSRYDTDKDGVCDAPECEDVLNLSGNLEILKRATPVVEASLEKIGITLKTRSVDDFASPLSTVARNIPMSHASGWLRDFPDPSTYMVLFDGRNIVATGNTNFSLVGLTPEQAGGIDGIEGNLEGIPSVDADIDRCTPLTGSTRTQCWADLDRRLMEEVIPWVPWLLASEIEVVGPAVTKYEFDQMAGYTAYAHVAVDPSKQST